jgi:hypothetical protein
MDEKRVPAREDRLKEYDELFTIGLGTGATVLALLSGADKIKTMLTAFTAGAPTLQTVLPVVLFVQTILLGVAWYVSGKHELALLARYYGDYAPRRSFATLPLIIFVSIVIVILSYYSDNILIYASLYAVYLVFAVGAGWLSSQHILKAMNEAKVDASVPPAFREEVYRYYVQRPGPVLGYFCGAVTFASITAGTLSRFTQVPGDRERFENIAYLAMVGSILIGEATVWTWRARLYNRTRDL